MSDPIPNPADRIYIRNLSHQIVNFVSSLEQLRIPSDASSHDRTCPMCKEHYALKLDHTNPEIPLRLPCNHVVGCNCLLGLLGKNPRSCCPICSESAQPQELEKLQPLMHVEQDRRVDIIRYLFFLLKEYHYPLAQKLLRDLDYGGYFFFNHEIVAAEKQDPRDDAQIAALRAEQEAYKAHWIHRSTLTYPAEFEVKMDQGRGGKPMKQWIQMCTIQAVAWVIQHQLSEDVLVSLVIPYVNNKDLVAYLDDEVYGVNGEGDMVHVYCIENKRSWPEVRGMWDMEVNRWRFDFPTQAPCPWDLATQADLDAVLGYGDSSGGCGV